MIRSLLTATVLGVALLGAPTQARADEPELHHEWETAAASRCYCSPYLRRYELYYVDRDGVSRYIYHYPSYWECMSALRRTALCR